MKFRLEILIPYRSSKVCFVLGPVEEAEPGARLVVDDGLGSRTTNLRSTSDLDPLQFDADAVLDRLR